MLTLARRPGESIQIGDDITITVIKGGSEPHLVIEAPEHIKIVRSELLEEEPKPSP